MSNRKTAIAACAVVLSLAGCADQTGTSLPEPPAAVGSSAPPVQDGPLTPTGTTLAFGEAARVMYETVSTHDPTNPGKDKTKIAVVPMWVERGSISDFRDVKLESDVLSKEFFYVTMSFTNLGPLPMDPTSVITSIEPYDAAGTKMNWLTIFGRFGRCHREPTDNLAVGATYTACGVWVAPEAQDVSKVVFSHYVDGDYTNVTEFTWPPR